MHEQELSAIYDQLPGIVFDVRIEPDGDFRFVSMSQAGLIAMGLAREQVVGALVRDVIPAPSLDLVLNHYREAIRSGRTVRWTEVSHYPAGRKFGEVAVTPLCDASGRATHLIGVVHDITEREYLKEAQQHRDERLAFLVRLNDAIRPLSSPVDIQDVTVRLLGEHLRVNRVGYAEIAGDEFIVGRSWVSGVAPLVERAPLASFGVALLEECRRGKTVVVEDVCTDARFSEAERTALLANDVGALVSTTLHKDGRWLAAFGVHCATSRAWKRDEIAVIEETGERTWAAAARAHAESALRLNEARLAFLLTLNDTLRVLSDPSDVQHAAARLLGEYLQVSRCGYAEIGERQFVVRGEHVRGVGTLGQGSVGGFGAALAEAYGRGETVVVSDVDTDSRFTEAERVTMRARQIAAFIGVTLIKRGRLVAAFGVNNTSPRVWTPLEVALVRDVAERTWDAAERATAEMALREREERLRLALKASRAGSWTRSAGTNQFDCDENYRRLHGFSPDEPATFEKWLACVHEEDRPRVLGRVDDKLTPISDEWDVVYRVVRPDGAVAWIQSVGRVERDASGEATRLAGLELDVTAQRQAEEARLARRDEEHDRELRLLLETATQGIVSVDVRGRILTANRACEVMFGWEPGELLGQSIERLVPASLRVVHGAHRGHYLSAPHPRPMAGGLDLLGERKDGSTFPIEVSLNHISTADGGRTIAFVTDITERQQAAAALRERTVELEQRSAQLSRLASDLTLAEQHAREELAKTLHDGLQQLLLIAALNLDQYLSHDPERGITPDEPLFETKHHLEEAIAAAKSLSVELFPTVLQSAGLRAALTWLANWTRSKYGLRVDISGDPRANSSRKEVRTLLFESVRELLINAVKHAGVDRVTVDVALDAGEMLCITVTDQGIGFDPARVSERAKAGQVGWGLFSISERLTLLGGRFEIESAPGHGSRFRLIAPKGQVSGVAAPVTVSDDAERLRAAHPLRILIADDHAAVRKVFRKLLEEQPALRVVGEAANGLDAIAEAHALHPDVVLMDVSMPQMDGVEATRRLRVEAPSIQILGLSMHPRTEHPSAIEQAGAADFFTKGVDTQRLIDYLLSMRAALVSGRAQPAK